ncbi:MAG TPA: O-antigen ligase family protein, partial [Dysgonamonadaceae bacterium]|nr:O-antigen ligase family protein [Dysgonamonadaceae bacterium]
LGQLYNYFPSGHALFKTTGSFFNSGPYGGFIALMFPLTLHYWICFKHRNKLLAYIFLFVGAISLLVFPATLSRTAWIAGIAGCGLVLVFDTRMIIRLLIFRKQHQKRFTFFILTLFLFLSSATYSVYYLKKDSANGRLFMWKVTTLAIKDNSINGVGLGGFSASYAKAQMDYFKSGKATDTEKLVAGSPEYAFNEYLRIFIEQGIIGGFLFLLLTISLIRSGIKNRQTGAAGSFLALSIFAFASYPYYLWEFLVVWVLLGTMCVSRRDISTLNPFSKCSTKRNFYIPTILLGALLAGSYCCAKHQYSYYQANKEWKKLRSLYTMKAYESIVDEYELLYPKLNYNPKFVFEYAVALNATEQHQRSDSVLSRGLQVSCDPMFYNVKGRNYHEMGEYDKAETAYTHSTYLLPERIYPYYLLTKLYADSANYHYEKMYQAASAVLEKEPKVHSMAINEMRDEVRKILKEKKEITYEK